MAITNGPNIGVAVNGDAGEAHYTQLMAQWRAIDCFLQGVYISVLSAPPATPADGDVYIVGASPSGAFATHTNKVARFSTVLNAWEFYTPKNGWQMNLASTGVTLKFVGGAWS